MSKIMNSRKKGFTAVELTMVATIIAIIALLVVPILRKRVEMAKITACQDELSTLAKMEILAHADTGYYFRLQDLDNTENISNPPNYVKDVPYFAWDGTPLNQLAISKRWGGPYVQYNSKVVSKTMTFSEALTYYPSYFYTTAGNPTGGIYYDSATATYYANDLLPLDPWGNPYFFFGPGEYDGETYYSCMMASLGPDGKCGDKNNPLPVKRSNFGQGNSDDIIYEFGG